MFKAILCLLVAVIGAAYALAAEAQDKQPVAVANAASLDNRVQDLKSDVINRKAPLSEDYQTEVTRPSWRAPVHKGDRIRITGVYEKLDHAWYTAMTHEGMYIDEQQPPLGRCKP